MSRDKALVIGISIYYKITSNGAIDQVLCTIHRHSDWQEFRSSDSSRICSKQFRLCDNWDRTQTWFWLEIDWRICCGRTWGCGGWRSMISVEGRLWDGGWKKRKRCPSLPWRLPHKLIDIPQWPIHPLQLPIYFHFTDCRRHSLLLHHSFDLGYQTISHCSRMWRIMP